MPVGGWFTMPQLTADGVMIIGDSAAMLNGERLKGIHTAIKAGMLAAETILEALLSGDFSRKTLGAFDKRLKESYVGRELYRSRNFHQAFDRGRLFGLMISGISTLTGGRLPGRIPIKAGHEQLRMLPADGRAPDRYADLKYDDTLIFNKLTDVYYSSTHHDEDQPPHLKVLDPSICVDRCVREYGNPCQNFCPASVYEMVDDGHSGMRLQINFSNCVHCKTCDIMDPYQIINWVPPEGGGGPNYRNM
jgi:electron-transferring-flavoprotein dehydrogenase